MVQKLKEKIITNEESLLSINKGIITYVNPFAYIKMRKNVDLSSIDGITSDGIVIKLLMKLFLQKKVERLSPDFSSYFKNVFENAENNNRTIFLIGTKQNLLELSINNILNSYPNLKIIGSRNGYFNSEKEIENCIDQIIETTPSIVIVGMGTPGQENFLINLKDKGFQGVGYACGGFLHQTASGTTYYPKWANKYNLRWFYRILDEPKLLKRYTIDYGWFLILFLWDFFKSTLQNKN